ncbi:dTDP-glucose 4,6-dehydratase [Candidatus Microgenomates bacterium]|nr:MAG: dTDP-glucose 4,6-dehydratase [Candidatus Microgenomates bacterium]
MKLLVTGGAGFIGANFILYWLKNHRDDRVVNLDALTYAGNLENLKSVEKHANYSFIKGDITDSLVVDQAMAGVDWVVHFAAESHVDRSISGPAIFLNTNVLGTQVLLDAAVKHNVKRFHHVSTDEVFGSLELGSSQKFSETTAYDPRSPYSASKAGSDHIVRAYFHTFHLPVTISNCSNNYGPFQHPEKLIPLTITNVLENKKVPVYGDGKNVRDWLYVTDHCRAIDAVLQKGKAGETYCVGGLSEDVSNLEIVKKIISIMGRDESLITFVKDRPGHDRRYAVDWSKMHKELGWQPEHDLDSYLKQTVDWYQTNTDWWQHVKNGTYRDYYEKQYHS